MPKINNIDLIKSFFYSSKDNIIINQLNGEIGLFYTYVIQYIALEHNINVYVTDGIQDNSNNLFGEIKMPVITTTSTNKINDILKSTQKTVINTDYKNYKKFSNQVTSINGYDYVKDLKNFLKNNLKIENDTLLNYCIETPMFTYSETSKFLVNKEGYYSDQLVQKDTNFILELRKVIFELKSKNKNIKNLYDKIKDESKYKKFNFLTY